MKRTCITALVVLGGLLAGGCRDLKLDPAHVDELDAGRETVSAALETIGGAERWNRAGTLQAVCVMAIHENGGAAYVTRQKQDINLADGTIRVEIDAPTGLWKAHADVTGAHGSSGNLGDPARAAQIERMLVMLIRRLRGPLGLLVEGVNTTDAAPTRLAGENVIRVGVTGDVGDVRAYYFDAVTRVLRYVTAGTDQPGQKGSATGYVYKLYPNGMAFPQRLHVTQVGEYTLIGKTPIVEVEYQQVLFD